MASGVVQDILYEAKVSSNLGEEGATAAKPLRSLYIM